MENKEEVLDVLSEIVDYVNYIKRSTDGMSSKLDIIVERLDDIRDYLSSIASAKR